MEQAAAHRVRRRANAEGRKIMSTHEHDERREKALDAAELLAEIAALRRRLDDLEAVPAASASRQKPGWLAWPRSVGRLVAAVAALGVLAGVSVVYGQGVKDALFVSPSGNVGIGVSQPVAKLDVDGEIRGRGGVQFPDGTKQMTSAGNLLKDAVIAFDLQKCPEGWAEYQAAYGRFIRGLDRGASRTDPDGLRPLAGFQTDAVQKITGKLYGVNGASNLAWAWGFRPSDEPGNAFLVPNSQHQYNTYGGRDYNPGTGDVAFFDSSRSVRTAAETRPVNVALLYCKKL
jgi:hypothetical protein